MGERIARNEFKSKILLVLQIINAGKLTRLQTKIAVKHKKYYSDYKSIGILLEKTRASTLFFLLFFSQLCSQFLERFLRTNIYLQTII
jgi:hypothetical protein